MFIRYSTENLSPYKGDITLVQFRPPQHIMMSIAMQSITAVCFGCTICALKGFMHRLPHHIPHQSLQWFRPHPEVPCAATNFVGPILMFFSCESKPAARTSGTACNIELQSNKSSQNFWKTASPNMRNVIVTTCSGRFPEFSRNLTGISPELPRNFRNFAGISGSPPEFPELWVLPEFQGQTNSRMFFRNLPVISGTCPEFPELSRNFPGIFREFSRNFPGTFSKLCRNFPGTFPGNT